MSLEDFAKNEAQARTDLHRDHDSQNIMQPGHDEVGLAGEIAFAIFSGLMWDTTRRPGGDGGKDFVVSLDFVVNVHTARNPVYLAHGVNAPFTASIYVLAGYIAPAKANLLGWAWKSALQQGQERDLGQGKGYEWWCHTIPRGELLPMEALKRRMRQPAL